MASMVCLGARVALVPDRGEWAYGATLQVVCDRSGREVRRELRGRELEVLDIVLFVELDDGERVASRPGENMLATRLPWTADLVRDDVRRIAYDNGDRPDRPRWRELLAGLESRGVRASDAALPGLPFVLELDDSVTARYEA
jgi:hypothetical protein